MDGRTDGRADRRTDGRTDGRMDRQTETERATLLLFLPLLPFVQVATAVLSVTAKAKARKTTAEGETMDVVHTCTYHVGRGEGRGGKEEGGGGGELEDDTTGTLLSLTLLVYE